MVERRPTLLLANAKYGLCLVLLIGGVVMLMREPISSAGISAWVCPSPVSRFVDSLANIDGQLNVGINFAHYRTAYTRAEVAYSRIPVKQLPYGCLSYVAVPAEKALNAYTVAYNIWSNCISTPGCNLRSTGVNRRLQFRWSVAHRNLKAAENNLAS